MLSLAEVENWHDSSFLVLRWIAFEDLLNELVVLLSELEGDTRIIFGGISMDVESVACNSCAGYERPTLSS